MFGKSVYLSTFDENKEQLLEENIDLYFTSLHISEEFDAEYKQKVKELFALLKQKEAAVIVDISPKAIKNLQMESIQEFLDFVGNVIIRCDYGFTREEILEIAKSVPVALNASTKDYELIKLLKAHGAKVCAVHNFYPRPETGLDEAFFRERNKVLRKMGMEPVAFITGDGKLRGPICEGLPTLEAHRYLPPYVQYALLKYQEGMSLIIVGDPQLSKQQQDMMIRLEKDGILEIPVTVDEKYANILDRVWTVRQDSPNRTARLLESREYSCFGTRIEPENCVERVRGSITIDNEKYLRYSGEIQIVKETLPVCEKVNVIGHVKTAYLPLLELLERGRRFKLISEPLQSCE